MFQQAWFKGLTLALYGVLFVSLGVYLARSFGVSGAPGRGEARSGPGPPPLLPRHPAGTKTRSSGSPSSPRRPW